MSDLNYKEVKISANSVLFNEGEPADFIYLIKSGSGVCLKENAGRLIKVGTFGEFDFAGSVDSLKEKKYSETTICTTNVEAVKLPVRDISKVLDSCPDWIQFLLKTILSRLDSSLDLITEHRINDNTNGDFTTEEEVKYKNILKGKS